VWTCLRFALFSSDYISGALICRRGGVVGGVRRTLSEFTIAMLDGEIREL
jgi:hypothetical protein